MDCSQCLLSNDDAYFQLLLVPEFDTFRLWNRTERNCEGAVSFSLIRVRDGTDLGPLKFEEEEEEESTMEAPSVGDAITRFWT